MNKVPGRPKAPTAEELRAAAEQVDREEAQAVRDEANGHVFVDTRGSVREAPVPLGLEGSPMAFPTDALPDPIRAYVEGIAASYEVPADLPGMLALGALATAVQGRWVVEARPNWRETTNLYTVVALEPGEQKSAAFKAIFGPFWEHERRLREGWDKVAAQLDQISVGKKRGEARNMAPPMPRLFVDDATPEVVAQILAEQGERLSVASDEGTIFSMICGLYTKTPNNGVFLKSHDGGRYTVDRRETGKHVTLKHPLLTMALAVQPEILRMVASKPELRGQGMWARFLYSIPESRIGTRTFDGAPVPWQSKDAYHTAISSMLLARPESWPKARDPFHPEAHSFKAEPGVVKFSREAWELMQTVCVELDRRMADGEDLQSIRDWVSKLRGAIVRLAGLFHIVRSVVEGQSPEATPIDLAELNQALLMGHYLLMHARRAFSTMESETSERDARLLLAWIQREKLLYVTRRQIQRESPVRKTGRVASALGLLLDLGHIEQVSRVGASRAVGYRVVDATRTSRNPCDTATHAVN